MKKKVYQNCIFSVFLIEKYLRNILEIQTQKSSEISKLFRNKKFFLTKKGGGDKTMKNRGRGEKFKILTGGRAEKEKNLL